MTPEEEAGGSAFPPAELRTDNLGWRKGSRGTGRPAPTGWLDFCYSILKVQAGSQKRFRGQSRAREDEGIVHSLASIACPLFLLQDFLGVMLLLGGTPRGILEGTDWH